MVEITIKKAEYINGYYYVEFIDNDTGKEYSTTYNAVRGFDIELIKQQIEKAFILKETGININGINLIAPIEEPAPQPEPEPTPLQLQEELVENLRAEKDQLKQELLELQEYAERFNKSIEVFGTDLPPEVLTLKTNLLSDIEAVTANFNQKLQEYRTEKAKLEEMKSTTETQ